MVNHMPSIPKRLMVSRRRSLLVRVVLASGPMAYGTRVRRKLSSTPTTISMTYFTKMMKTMTTSKRSAMTEFNRSETGKQDFTVLFF